MVFLFLQILLPQEMLSTVGNPRSVEFFESSYEAVVQLEWLKCRIRHVFSFVYRILQSQTFFSRNHLLMPGIHDVHLSKGLLFEFNELSCNALVLLCKFDFNLVATFLEKID